MCACVSQDWQQMTCVYANNSSYNDDICANSSSYKDDFCANNSSYYDCVCVERTIAATTISQRLSLFKTVGDKMDLLFTSPP